jgi:hypothetical protein
MPSLEESLRGLKFDDGMGKMVSFPLLAHKEVDSERWALTHPLTYSITPSLTYSHHHLLTYSITHSITHILTHSLTHSLTPVCPCYCLN